MRPQLYYYGSGGGEVQGPMGIDWIRAEIIRGELDAGVMVSETPSGPWIAPGMVVTVKATPQQQLKTISGTIEMVGRVQLGIGVVCVILFIIAMLRGGDDAATVAFYAITSLISGVFTLGIAEGLLRLTQILSELKKRNE